MTLRPPYAFAAIIVFCIEVFIALYVRDDFVRPHLGDALVIVLIYLAIRAVTPVRVVPAVALTLGIAVVVEFSQLFQLVRRLGLEDNSFARVVLGTGFDPKDFIAYASGGMAVLAVEALRRQRLL